MSRHSKWSKIKRQKATADARRGQLFSKLSKTISVAAREGGRNPETNFRLRMAIGRALAENMPKENIQRAIDRAAGEGTEAAITSLTLEGHGPGKSAFLIDVVTDNRNRTVSDIRHILSEGGGALSDAGSTQWMFKRRGRIFFEDLEDIEAAELAAIDAGAEETIPRKSSLEVITLPERLQAVAEKLQSQGFSARVMEITMIPRSLISLSSADQRKLRVLLGKLEDHEDVVGVVTNTVLGKEE